MSYRIQESYIYKSGLLISYTTIIIIIQNPTKPTTSHQNILHLIPTAPPRTLLPVLVAPAPPTSGLVLPPSGAIVLLLALIDEAVILGVDVALGRLDAGREIVVFPITNFAPGSRSMDVPLIFRPGPPAVMVVPSTEKAVGLGVNVWPAMV